MSDESNPEPTETTALSDSGALGESTRAALDDIEGRPLEERAVGYRLLADGLRAELEQSDPTRSAS